MRCSPQLHAALAAFSFTKLQLTYHIPKRARRMYVITREKVSPHWIKKTEGKAGSCYKNQSSTLLTTLCKALCYQLWAKIIWSPHSQNSVVSENSKRVTYKHVPVQTYYNFKEDDSNLRTHLYPGHTDLSLSQYREKHPLLFTLTCLKVDLKWCATLALQEESTLRIRG